MTDLSNQADGSSDELNALKRTKGVFDGLLKRVGVLDAMRAVLDLVYSDAA
jgi:hypothetical protein